MATASIAIGANTGKGARECVAAALDVLDEFGIHYELTAMATNVEGDVRTICDALVAIHKRCHELGALRVESLLKIDDRIDVGQTLESKVRHVIEARRAPGQEME
ncbi:MAG TPA: MTH1187 family thiamine-binding protein [Candidatus Acidoferrales bacterium]|nr:MTH1187 family thiamine-binding protein [Candidatus Acidoferrales bacterium]